MSRKMRREIIARLVSVLLCVIPVSCSIVAAVLIYSYFGWEGRAGAVFAIGAIMSIGFGVAVGTAWARYSDVQNYPRLYEGRSSFLREWINEPEPEKKQPKAGSWKED